MYPARERIDENFIRWSYVDRTTSTPSMTDYVAVAEPEQYMNVGSAALVFDDCDVRERSLDVSFQAAYEVRDILPEALPVQGDDVAVG